MSATVEVNKMTRYFGHNMDSFAMEDQLGRITIETASHEIYEKFLDEFAEQSDIFVSPLNAVIPLQG
jgi:malonyl CoA-acyl carrier protein transacylase